MAIFLFFVWKLNSAHLIFLNKNHIFNRVRVGTGGVYYNSKGTASSLCIVKLLITGGAIFIAGNGRTHRQRRDWALPTIRGFYFYITHNLLKRACISFWKWKMMRFEKMSSDVLCEPRKEETRSIFKFLPTVLMLSWTSLPRRHSWTFAGSSWRTCAWSLSWSAWESRQ